MTSELVFTSAVDQAAMVRARQVSAVELLDAHVAQIERINPQVNALVSLDVERAVGLAPATATSG